MGWGTANIGGGGSGGLNFKVVSNPQPERPKENTIWVDTDVSITNYHFGVEEPNVYDIQVIASADPWSLVAPHSLNDGDIINFTIPATVSSTFEAIRIYDSYTGKTYYIRDGGGAAVPAWPAGETIALRISNDKWLIEGWGDGGTAYVVGWGSYYHEEGTAWIYTGTGTASPVTFNALKKNSLQVYPISAKQYVGGAWVNVIAKSYQNGAWVTWWNGELYDAGNEFDFITGGWSSSGWTVKGSSGTVYTSADGTKGEDYLQIRYSSNSVCYMFGTENKVNLTGYNTLEVECERTSGAEMYVVLPQEKSVTVTVTTPSVAMSASGVATLDISSVDSAYIALVPRLSASSIPNWKITKVRLLR